MEETVQTEDSNNDDGQALQHRSENYREAFRLFSTRDIHTARPTDHHECLSLNLSSSTMVEPAVHSVPMIRDISTLGMIRPITQTNVLCSDLPPMNNPSTDLSSLQAHCREPPSNSEIDEDSPPVHACGHYRIPPSVNNLNRCRDLPPSYSELEEDSPPAYSTYLLQTQGRIQGGPGGPAPPDHQK